MHVIFLSGHRSFIGHYRISDIGFWHPFKRSDDVLSDYDTLHDSSDFTLMSGKKHLILLTRSTTFPMPDQGCLHASESAFSLVASAVEIWLSFTSLNFGENDGTKTLSCGGICFFCGVDVGFRCLHHDGQPNDAAGKICWRSGRSLRDL